MENNQAHPDSWRYTDDEIASFQQHHIPRRHSKHNEEVLPECPYGRCLLIDNEYVELCEICERDEQLHYETIKGKNNG